jgi:hypothetical protein
MSMSRSGATDGERGPRISGCLVEGALQRSDARVSKNDAHAADGPPNRGALMKASHAEGIATLRGVMALQLEAPYGKRAGEYRSCRAEPNLRSFVMPV